MDDDQARLTGPPDAQLIEPRDPGLYVVIVVHARKILCAVRKRPAAPSGYDADRRR